MIKLNHHFLIVHLKIIVIKMLYVFTTQINIHIVVNVRQDLLEMVLNVMVNI